MMKSKLTFLMLLVAATVLVAPAVLAASPAGGSVTPIATKGPYPSSAAGQVSANAGYIYETNVTGNMSTYHWAGVYGNATGYLILGDTSGNEMFKWPAKANYVYFTEAGTLDLASYGSATCTDVDDHYTYLSGASDDCTSTFTDSGVSWNTKIGPSGVTTIAAKTYDDTKTPTWVTLALTDGTNILFAAEANPSLGNAFDGTKVNYQAILPDDGENGDTQATTYNVWIELY